MFDKASTAGEPLNLKAVSRSFSGINQPNGAAYKKGSEPCSDVKRLRFGFMLRCIFSGHEGSVERKLAVERNSWSSTDCNSWPGAQINEVLRGPQDSRQISLMNLRSWRRRQIYPVPSRAEFRPLNPFAFAFEGLIIFHVASLALRHDKLPRRICWAKTVSHCGRKAADKNGQKKMKTMTTGRLDRIWLFKTSNNFFSRIS